MNSNPEIRFCGSASNYFTLGRSLGADSLHLQPSQFSAFTGFLARLYNKIGSEGKRYTVHVSHAKADNDENTMEGYAEGDTMADAQATGWDSGNEMMANDAPAEDGDAMEGGLMEGDPMEDGQGQDP